MPLLTIAASALKGPLLLRQHGGAADYSVEIAAAGQRLTVGRIMAVQRASGSERGGWLWTITGPAAPGSGIALSGEAGSVEEARRAFRATFRPAGGVVGFYGLRWPAVARWGGTGGG
jgi:hypothetical protein